jgi:hypothetical protein
VGTKVTSKSVGGSIDGTRRYECLIAHTAASGTVDAPYLNTTGATPKWLDLGATNRYAFCDDKWGTRTVGANNNGGANVTLTVENYGTVTLVAPSVLTIRVNYSSASKYYDSLAVLNIAGRYVRVKSSIPGFDRTIQLQTNIGVSDWKEYFLAEIVSQSDAVFNDLPNFINQDLDITVYGTSGQIVGIGGLSVGKTYNIGTLQWSPTVSINDYSVKTVDAYGNITVTKRAYSKKFGGKLLIENAHVDTVASILASVRSTPCVWIGAGNDYSSLIVWGFYKDFEIDIAYPLASYCSITIEGLI